jgi:hypothetical protein
MNLYIYRKLTVAEKKTIMYSVVFVFFALILILATMPETEKECLIKTATPEVASITVRPGCLEMIVNSMLLMSQISHVIKLSLSSIVIYLIMLFVVKFARWVNRSSSE